tara:strand:- start:178 stop:513 length:336 start_codon:yes stop_codon:yes gene_type:complete
MRLGARIIEVCEILEEFGPAGTGDIAQEMALTESGEVSNAGKYCSRAVKMGLMTVAKSPVGYHYNVYTVKPDWRNRIKGENHLVKQERPNPCPVEKPGMFSYVASIFQVGA